MIWSSLARNRSPDPVVLCFFGRIATSDATTESRPVIRRNPENEIAGFRCPKHQNPAIPKPATTTNAILAQSLSHSSRTPIYYLRDEAAKYRKITERTDDPVIKNEMLDLASVCIEVADNIEDH